jgi:hypothetical protein
VLRFILVIRSPFVYAEEVGSCDFNEIASSDGLDYSQENDRALIKGNLE